MITLGADPEMLLQRDGEYVSVEGMIGGTKEVPVPIPGIPKSLSGYTMQEDNVMLEFNIPPATCAESFSSSIAMAMTELEHGVLVPNSVTISDVCYAEYPEDQLSSGQAQTFGCSPDNDAYLGGATADGVSTTLVGNRRFAGGHIHVGYSNPANIPDFVVVKLLDAYAGLGEVIHGYTQGGRRGFYGTAGRYRPKSYGVEYRTLSNCWLFNSEARESIVNGVECVAKLIDSGDARRAHSVFSEIPFNEVRNAINNEDGALAHDLWRHIWGLPIRQSNEGGNTDGF